MMQRYELFLGFDEKRCQSFLSLNDEEMLCFLIFRFLWHTFLNGIFAIPLTFCGQLLTLSLIQAIISARAKIRNIHHASKHLSARLETL